MKVTLAVTSGLLALTFATAARAMPEQVCEARCNKNLNPVDYPKEQREYIWKQHQVCMRYCRASKI